MKRPIQSGDQCLVIRGLARHKSPNLGLTVTVGMRQGEHQQHGVIWRCTGDGVKQMTDAGTYMVTGVADFAASWLQRIEPPPLKQTTKESELTHG